jgi:FixJ family two-component response regulator
LSDGTAVGSLAPATNSLASDDMTSGYHRFYVCARDPVTNFERVMKKKCLISVVDDDQCVRESLEHLIHSMDCYRVASFASAKEYLQSDLVPQTSCLITDYQMPGMTGADLQSHLIADGYRIPIIFLAANCGEENRNRVLNGGALCVLDKPFDEKLLFEWLKRVCSN